ncbi:hypothetical protein KFE25_001952 [Diacronema lutheri]|uniref:(2Fe-2S) ferredoxin domain-containing protein n=1 Tax=Diacronema lutheri TaxID=2081491 RepID=A0A8J5XCJ6_DIALT|nr:hypothetical protein KFE25_001952 [Diacronema lutheri]
MPAPDVLLRELQARREAILPHVRLCVCSGHTCSQRGSEAVLVELEELCAEAAGKGVGVERVGCSHQCDKAPVVHIVSKRARPVLIVECVDDPLQCERTVRLALAGDGQPTGAPCSGITSGLMGLFERRSASARWEALRALGRAHDNKSRSLALEQLDEAVDAELRACAMDGAAAARASRRAARLRARFVPKVDRALKLRP